MPTESTSLWRPVRRAGITVFAVAAMLAATIDLHAQGAATVAPESIRAAGGFIALSVADLDASAIWYQDKLGLRVAMRPPKNPNSSVVVLEGDGLIVELVQHDEAKSLAGATSSTRGALYVHGIFKAGVMVEDLDRLLVQFRERGVPIAIGPFPARDGQRANFIVRDNAGNFLQFVQR